MPTFDVLSASETEVSLKWYIICAITSQTPILSWPCFGRNSHFKGFLVVLEQTLKIKS